MIHMDDENMDHQDRLRENLAVLGVERMSSFKVLDEFGTVVDKKFPVHFISTKRLLHIYISWLYDRLIDIDLSDENAARDEIRSWHAYLRGCYIGDDLLADAFKDWEAEHLKIDPSSSRRLRFAWIELNGMLNFETSSSHDSLSSQNVNKAVPSSEVDDDSNVIYFFDTVGRSRSINNNPATRPREPKDGDNHWGAIHPDRLVQSQEQADDPSDPSGGGDLTNNKPPPSFLTGANQLAYLDSAELTSRRRSNAQKTPVVHHSPGRFSQDVVSEDVPSSTDASSPADTSSQQSNSQQKSNLPKVQNRSEKKTRGQYSCKRCNRPGHRMEDCPTGLDPRYDLSPREGYVCTWCNKPGHYSTVCPKNTLEDSVNQRRLRAGIIQPETPESASRSPRNPPQRESWRDERIRDRGEDRYIRRRSLPSIDEPRRGRQRGRAIDRYQSYRARSPLRDRSYTRWSSGGGRDRYRSRSPRNIEHRDSYDAAERSRERSRERRTREGRSRERGARERESNLRLTPPAIKSFLHQPVGNNRVGFQQLDRKERAANFMNKTWIKFKDDIRQPTSKTFKAEGSSQEDRPREREADSKMTVPKFRDDICLPLTKTFIAEDRSQDGRPRGREFNHDVEEDRSQERKTEVEVAKSKVSAPTVMNILRQPVNKIIAEDCSQDGKPRERKSNHDAEEDRSQECKTEELVADSKTAAPTFQNILRQPVGKINAGDLSQKDKPSEQDAYAKIMAPDTESRPQEDKPSEQDANAKTTMPDLETILQLMTDEKRLYTGSYRRVPKRDPLNSVLYDEHAEFDNALHHLISEASSAAMFSDLSLDDAPIPVHTMPAPIKLGITVKALDGDTPYHPKVLDLFRDRQNVWLHQIQRICAKDYWASTFVAGLGERSTPAVNEPDRPANDLNDTGMTGDAIFQQAMDDPDSRATDVNDTDMTGDTIVQQADIYTPASAVDLETMDYELSLGATIEVGDDSFTDKGDSLVGDKLPLELPNGVGEDDSFTEKGDSMMEDVESLQLEKVE